MAEVCPFTENCVIYKNWKNKTGRKEIDVITKYYESYECLAKSVLEDSSPRNLFLDKTRKRLSNVSSPCSYITLLNLLNNLTK